MFDRRVAGADDVEGCGYCAVGNSEARRSNTGLFRKAAVHVGGHEKQFLRVITCCALRKLSGAFGSFLPRPVKWRPRAGLYKETILMGFPDQRSHHSLRDQQKVFTRKAPVLGFLLSLRLLVFQPAKLNIVPARGRI